MDVFVLGAYMTQFGKMADRSYKDLTREVVEGVVADAGLEHGREIASAWFGSCSLPSRGQSSIAGQVCLTPLAEAGLLAERMPVANVENACATSSTAFLAAAREIRAGEANLVLVVGVDKLTDLPSREAALAAFGGGMDRLDPDTWLTEYRSAADDLGVDFAFAPDRTPFMDTYAMQALWHMRAYGTTRREIAAAAAKSHRNGALNPSAHYRFAMSTDEVLGDRPITPPLTRSMCAPVSDGGAALLLCSRDFLEGQSREVQDRSLAVRACSMVGGKRRALSEPSLSAVAAAKAYSTASIEPGDVDVAEVHDATSFSEVFQAEMLGFCPSGGGGVSLKRARPRSAAGYRSIRREG